MVRTVSREGSAHAGSRPWLNRDGLRSVAIRFRGIGLAPLGYRVSGVGISERPVERARDDVVLPDRAQLRAIAGTVLAAVPD